MPLLLVGNDGRDCEMSPFVIARVKTPFLFRIDARIPLSLVD